MSRDWTIFIGIGLLVFYLFGGNIPRFQFSLDSLIPDKVERTIVKPRDLIRKLLNKDGINLLDKITQQVKSGPNPSIDGMELYNYFTQFAELAVSTGIVDNPSQLRSAYILGGQYHFNRLGMKNKYPGLAASIDEALAAGVGLENVQFDEERKNLAVEVLNAIAWACYEGAN